MNCIAFIILSYATSGGHILVLPLKMINVFLDNTIQKNIFFLAHSTAPRDFIAISLLSLTNGSDVLIRYQPFRTHGAPHLPQAHAIFSIVHHQLPHA